MGQVSKTNSYLQTALVILLLSIQHISSSTSANATTYHVTPEANTTCPEAGVPCMTFSQYANSQIGYFAANTTLILLPGNHSLDTTFMMANITSLAILGNTSDVQETRVLCMQSLDPTLKFQDIDEIHMYGIVLSGCISDVASVDQFSFKQCILEGSIFGSKLQLSAVNYAYIFNSYFTMNRLDNAISNVSISKYGGAVYIYQSNVTILNSSFSRNYAYYGGSVYAFNSSVAIHKSTFTDNMALYHGGAIYIFQECTVVIDSCVFTDNSIKERENNIIPAFGGGALSALSSTIIISNSDFVNNSAEVIVNTTAGGAVFAALYSTLIINDSTFSENRASDGGGAVATGLESATFITNTMFINNTAATEIIPHVAGGGACVILLGNITVDNCTFVNNVAKEGGGGGAIGFSATFAFITNSEFIDNLANFGGGAIGSVNQSVSHIGNCSFNNNTVLAKDSHSGAIECQNSFAAIQNCSFVENTVVNGSGGAMNIYCDEVCGQCGGTLENSIFNCNTALNAGGAITLFRARLKTMGFIHFYANKGTLGTFYAGNSEVLFNGSITFSDNVGSIYAFASKVTIVGEVTVTNNTFENSLHQGGALTAYQSDISFNGRIFISGCRVTIGGAILAIESIIDVTGELTIANNVALRAGGGIYAYQSKLYFIGTTNIIENTANESGGGIHAVSATIELDDGSLFLKENNAPAGGGLYLESDAKLYLAKQKAECKQININQPEVCQTDKTKWLHLEFSNNSADYGGAIYADDDTTSSICSSMPSEIQTTSTECFFQVLAHYDTSQVDNLSSFAEQVNYKNVLFVNNSARMAGESLYGGLLDRCRISPFAEVFIDTRTKAEQQTYYFDARIYYMSNISNLQVKDVDSMAVRVCFCKNNQQNCSYQPTTFKVRKGETFNVSVVAVDQVEHPKAGIMFTYIDSSDLENPFSLDETISEGQSIQSTERTCSELTYNVISPPDIRNATLSLFAFGPCVREGISTVSFEIDFVSCPIGFKESEKGCECDPILFDEYIVSCSIDSQTVSKRDDWWISFDNTTTPRQYIVYPNPPFDYNDPSITEINLNLPNGADAQCAFNRTGVLCGRCNDGLSLLLGSSRCDKCSYGGLALILVFGVAGIALVAFILVCNLTVAVGTLNGLIFYANVVTANRAAFFPPDTPRSILTVFIAWINLDFGFEYCFYDGMDAYSRTWLQLVFPIYILSLVGLIMIICEYWQRFAKLISNKNPVATLATLILLSYTKFVRFCISSGRFSRITYLSVDSMNDSHSVVVSVWSEDGNLKYQEGKHIPLFVVALIVALVYLVYTFLLLLWQFLVHCPNKHPTKWVYSPKLKSFLDAYHGPFKKNHRYWLGLQLLFRAILYTFISINFNVNDPEIDLLAITLAAGILLLLINLTGGGIYRQWPLNTLESSFLFNLLLFTAVTSYVRNTNGNSQVKVAHVSASVAFVTFLAILIYHSYTYIFANNISPLQNFTKKLCKNFHKKHNPKQSGDSTKRSTEPLITSNIYSRPRMSLEVLATDLNLEDNLYHQYDACHNIQTQKKIRVVTHAVIDGVPHCIEENLENSEEQNSTP